MSNPLLEPIHGVSLQDYSVVSAKMASGISEAEILNALGIEKAVFDEASALWIARMQEDGTFEIATLFGQYFGEPDKHPKLGNLKAEVSEEGQANLEKMKTDRYFYEELSGARQAAYEYGIDGAQWIQNNFGISLGDFQIITIQWLSLTADDSFEISRHFQDYRDQKEKEYSEKFAAEQGGNVADDVEF
ncbi:DUF6620 family protein [Flavobacterium microcysteis]|uniref:Uncharacterized protein n=1 Tax=Flavobacterium microcysteis TaxID=2596891 RepID=A0A501Q4P7_9FLAO|nr:DUF6620 family protein [Flavobacterium microcysteis]TPD66996.1 hypothetical protein FJA49_11995 [Flavobacterium microcysteis]